MVSEEGGGVGMVGPAEEEVEDDLEFRLAEFVDQLSDKKLSCFLLISTQ